MAITFGGHPWTHYTYAKSQFLLQILTFGCAEQSLGVTDRCPLNCLDQLALDGLIEWRPNPQLSATLRLQVCTCMIDFVQCLSPSGSVL